MRVLVERVPQVLLEALARQVACEVSGFGVCAVAERALKQSRGEVGRGLKDLKRVRRGHRARLILLQAKLEEAASLAQRPLEALAEVPPPLGSLDTDLGVAPLLAMVLAAEVAAGAGWIELARLAWAERDEEAFRFFMRRGREPEEHAAIVRRLLELATHDDGEERRAAA